MNRYSLTLIMIFLLSFSFAQKLANDYLLLTFDTNFYDNYCYLNKKGDTIIPPGKYMMCYTDTFYNTAFVFTSSDGLIMINRNEELLVHVFPFDNGPDYPSEGLFRIMENDLIGYADLDGNIVIEPSFECAFPFREGFASFCTGGILLNDGEHSWWKNAKWGAMDTKGNITIKAVYDTYFEFHDGKAIVELNNEAYEIDTAGNHLK